VGFNFMHSVGAVFQVCSLSGVLNADHGVTCRASKRTMSQLLHDCRAFVTR